MTQKHITNKISNIFHKFATTKFPLIIQILINYGYVKILKLNMDEFKKPSEYKTLNELFTRALTKYRDFDKSSNNFISPVDSYITSAGEIKNNIALQIKGISYNIKKLLTSKISSDNFNKIKNGEFINMYLSPRDYHRYHSPFDAKITKLIHIPAKLYPVNFTYLNKQPNLFIENERVVLECITNNDKLFYMIFIGALNVGKMVFNFDSRIETNSNINEIKEYKYDNLIMKKGECLGYFKMGSTVLIFWEKDMVKLKDLINQKVKFTQVIAEIKK